MRRVVLLLDSAYEQGERWGEMVADAGPDGPWRLFVTLAPNDWRYRRGLDLGLLAYHRYRPIELWPGVERLASRPEDGSLGPGSCAPAPGRCTRQRRPATTSGRFRAGAESRPEVLAERADS